MKRYTQHILLSVLLALISCHDGGSGSNTEYHYHTPEEINILLSEIESNYPDIAKVEKVGTTGTGRIINALIISDSPDSTAENEPAVRLTGGIHGNEMMGVELLLRFIQYLTSNYSTDSKVAGIVDSRYICIIPVLNPDGLADHSRYNNNGVDLNRNFDDSGNHYISDPPYFHHGEEAFSELETQAMVSFSSSKNFNLSITYHVGAVLVNMPFDYASETIDGVYPDEKALIKSHALAYTAGTESRFLDNPDVYNYIYNSGYSLNNGYINLDRGTINGGDWYVITGSLQDWSITKTGCLDLTIEVAEDNPETEDGVEKIFMYNRDSLMEYISSATTSTFTGIEAP